MGGFYDFIVGTAVLTLPKHNVAVLGVDMAIRLARHLNRKLASRKLKETGDLADDSNRVEGKVDKVLLEWSDVTCTINDSTGRSKQVLQGSSGSAQPGRLLALMGPSGSGKTTLLNSLAGQVPHDKKLTLTGSILVNGQPASTTNHRQAYVEQSDLFYSMLTVKETLDMASQLQLPEGRSAEEQQRCVDNLMAVLGLAKVSDTVVGDEKNRGLSGGEKKRLSIGCELISQPSLIFLDEPTTGLDSFQAEKVVSVLKKLAEEGHTVVCSVHQPRSSIFEMFDDLILLSEGRTVYSGPAKDVLGYFAALGYRCPDHYNPAEFVADLISVDFGSPEAEVESRVRVEQLVAHHQDKQSQAYEEKAKYHRSRTGDLAVAHQAKLTPNSTLAKQFRLLLKRSWNQVTRDKAATIARLTSNLSSATVFGAIFFRMKMSQSSIQDRLGLLQVCAINTAMSALIKTITVFPTERTIIQRERAKGSYKILPYLTAKVVAELPISTIFPLVFGCAVYPVCGLNPKPSRFLRFLGILTLESFSSAALGLSVGAFAPSTEAALAMGPAVMLIWIVFGGYYVNAENVPGPLKFLPKASLIKQGFEALCINEFDGMEFDADDQGGGMRTGSAVLHWLSFEDPSIPKKLMAQCRILACYYWLTYNILKAKKPEFQKMIEPVDNSMTPSKTASGALTSLPEESHKEEMAVDKQELARASDQEA